MNVKLKRAIDTILVRSKRPTIIILQGDHGPGSMLDWKSAANTNMPERLSILSAYYFPDKQYDLLYDKITPVNTFRLIFHQYFGEAIGRFEDKSYFSVWNTPWDFIDVTDTVDSWRGTAGAIETGEAPTPYFYNETLEINPSCNSLSGDQ